MSPSDWRMIVEALLAVSPSGGGSYQYHLALRVAEEHEVVWDDSSVMDLQRIAAMELCDD